MQSASSESINSGFSGNKVYEGEVKVVISDDHSLVRHGIRAILEESPKFKVVGEAGNADETLEIVEKLKPDFLILDLGLPHKSGLEVIYGIKERKLNTEVIVLSMYDDDLRVVQAMKAGARGYLIKDSSPEEFFAALDTIKGGEKFLPKQFAHLKGEIGVDEAKKEGSKENDPLAKLSKREREVFFLLSEGLPNRTIAQKLFIGPRTVETHRARVIKKLKCKSTADLIRYAIRHNLMSV